MIAHPKQTRCAARVCGRTTVGTATLAATAQICNDGRANVWRYRHPCTLSALGANEYLAGAPVDIIERERRDFVGPQAELGQQQQNGVVAPSHHRLSVATVESLPHLCGRQIGLQSCELPSPHRWNAIRQGARSAPDGGGNGERRATTSASPCLFPGSNPGHGAQCSGSRPLV